MTATAIHQPNTQIGGCWVILSTYAGQNELLCMAVLAYLCYLA